MSTTKFGQRLAAYVVRRPGAELGEADLKKHVKAQLAGYKVPREVHFLDELPRNATGKVLKRALGGGRWRAAPKRKWGEDIMERLSGPDALMLNMETRTTPMHTLKIAVIDTSRRGKPVTLRELEDVLPRYLGRFPRATQHLERLPAYQARPFWVRDKEFDIRNHLEEVTLPAPGRRTELDAVLAGLAVRQLDRHRPLWALTLVHGVTGGRQAVVVRIHHAVADGLAALNTFRAPHRRRAGSSSPRPSTPSAPADRRVLGRMAREESRRLIRAMPGMVGGLPRRASQEQHADSACRSRCRATVSTPRVVPCGCAPAATSRWPRCRRSRRLPRPPSTAPCTGDRRCDARRTAVSR